MIFFSFGLKLDQLVERLKRRLAGSTPAAIVSQAGYQDGEKVIHSNLNEIAETMNGKVNPRWHLLYVGQALA